MPVGAAASRTAWALTCRSLRPVFQSVQNTFYSKLIIYYTPHFPGKQEQKKWKLFVKAPALFYPPLFLHFYKYNKFLNVLLDIFVPVWYL